jgi:RNA polymerase sigma-70 factor (ECF subfamily)
LPPTAFAELFREARRATRRADEAEDLFQTIWLAAIEAGREDLSSPFNRRWFVGALRKRALFEARSAVRRRNREQVVTRATEQAGQVSALPLPFLTQLPARLRTTALLVLAGHNKHEIAWLLRIKEPALRQRIAEIRRRWQASGGGSLDGFPGLSGPLNFGSIRQALLSAVRQRDAALASHDPDGHLFVVSASRKAEPRQLASVPHDGLPAEA